MSTRERPRDDQDSPDAQTAEHTTALGNQRQAGEEFLRAGDEAIDRALSRDSAQFLRANQQAGGE